MNVLDRAIGFCVLNPDAILGLEIRTCDSSKFWCAQVLNTSVIQYTDEWRMEILF